jgi:hypothetical protein
MRTLTLITALGGIALVHSAHAQPATTPVYWRIVEWQTPPGEMGAFRTSRFGGLVKIAQAAKAPASQGWQIWTAENRTAVVRPVDPKDPFANPVAPLRESQPELYRQWQAGLTAGSSIVSNEIVQELPQYSYVPASETQFTGASVAEVRILSGKGAAYDTARRDFVAFRKKIGYPYAVRAFRVIAGETRDIYVTYFDSREKFFGVNAQAGLVEKAGAGAEWQALAGRLTASMDRQWDTKLWSFNPALSYIPQQP